MAWKQFLFSCLVITLAGCATSGGRGRGSDDDELQAQLQRLGKAAIVGKQMDNVLDLLDRADAYRQLCLNEYSQGNAQAGMMEIYGREAKNWYRRILELEPSNAYASLSIGYVDMILAQAALTVTEEDNHYAAAMSRFREALEKRPGYANAYLRIAQVHAFREEYSEAERNLRPILDSGIEDSEIHSWMAFVYLRTNRQPEAQKHLSRSIELDDPSASARWAREHQ